MISSSHRISFYIVQIPQLSPQSIDVFSYCQHIGTYLGRFYLWSITYLIPPLSLSHIAASKDLIHPRSTMSCRLSTKQKLLNHLENADSMLRDMLFILSKRQVPVNLEPLVELLLEKDQQIKSTLEEG
ncbi:unnamed protein product [Dicrocoelium dendriticum]|nr:unnamed protein product [Dicrocoelium dendriticum]